MMRYLSILYFVMLPLIATAQIAGSGLALGLAPAGAGYNLSETDALKLKSKMLQIVQKSGVATISYASGISLKPVLTVEDTRISEGGMENITVTKAELILLLVNAADDGIIYSSLSRKITGSGSSPGDALYNAIVNLDVTDKLYTEFLAKAEQKISEYYAVNCDLILERATRIENQRNYESAVALLYSIPSGTPCYAAAHKKALWLFNRYEKQLCEKIVTYARGEAAIGNMENALEALWAIEGRSACAAETNRLISDIEKKTQQHLNRQYSIEAQRAKAVEMLAMAYYTRSSRKRK